MIRKNISTALALITVLFVFRIALAEKEKSETVKVSQAAIAAGVKALAPQGVSDRFPSTIGKLYAFSKITGIPKDTFVKHQWYYGDKLMTEIRLSVKPASWRTYSSKTILPEWTGQWHVKILDEDSKVLKTLPFTIE